MIIAAQRNLRETVQSNQKLGAEIERLVKTALEALDLKVTRTGVGSDFEIGEDYLIDGEEMLLNIEGSTTSCLLEIKATARNVAKMTAKQAETAVSNQKGFALCVVRLDGSALDGDLIERQARFVFDIGEQVQPVWNEYCRYRDTKTVACSRVGAVELMVDETNVRFGVTEDAWAAGIPLGDAVDYFLRLCSRSSKADQPSTETEPPRAAE